MTNIKNILLKQNPHWQNKNKESFFIGRKIINNIKLRSNFIEIITGVRRSGKSTMFNIIISHLIKEKIAESKEILFVNFDNPSFIPFYKKVEDLDLIIDEAETLTGKKVKFLFLDEIQNIFLWEKWVKAIYDQRILKKIFITGSNSNLLESEYISRLSGRYFSYINTPFSFKEYLEAKKQKYNKQYIDNFPIKNRLLKLFNQYLKTGGFPEVVIYNDLDIIDTYYQTIILKDAMNNSGVRDGCALKELAYFLITNCANFFSYNKIAKHLKISEKTVREYIDCLKSAYLFYELKKYDFSVKKQNVNKKKIYTIDNGFISQIGFNFSENNGKYLENLIFIELFRRKEEIFYCSGIYECDFVLKRRGKIFQAIQVCYEINSKNKKREFNGLIEAMDKYNLKSGIIITNKQYDEIKINSKKISIIPAWQWLLSE